MFPDSLSHIGPQASGHRIRLPKATRSILLKNVAGEYGYAHCGFSWSAFFLGDLWLIAKGMWGSLIPVVALEIALWLCSGHAEAQHNHPLFTVCCIANVCFAVIRGEYSNRWHLASLLDRGFVRVFDH